MANRATRSQGQKEPGFYRRLHSIYSADFDDRPRRGIRALGRSRHGHDVYDAERVLDRRVDKVGLSLSVFLQLHAGFFISCFVGCMIHRKPERRTTLFGGGATLCTRPAGSLSGTSRVT